MFDINLYLFLMKDYKKKFRKTHDKWSLTEKLIYDWNSKYNKKIN